MQGRHRNVLRLCVLNHHGVCALPEPSHGPVIRSASAGSSALGTRAIDDGAGQAGKDTVSGRVLWAFPIVSLDISTAAETSSIWHEASPHATEALRADVDAAQVRLATRPSTVATPSPRLNCACPSVGMCAHSTLQRTLAKQVAMLLAVDKMVEADATTGGSAGATASSKIWTVQRARSEMTTLCVHAPCTQ